MKIFQYTFVLFLTCFNLIVKANLSENSKETGKISLNVFANSGTTDTLTVALWNTVIDIASNNTKIYTAIKNDLGYYKFEIPVSNFQGYFLISSSPDLMQRMLAHQLWEVGDSVNIYLSLPERKEATISTKVPMFTGPGSEKYTVKSMLSQMNTSAIDADKKLHIAGEQWNGNILEWDQFDAQSNMLKAKLRYLDSHKSKLSDISYNVLKADLFFDQKNTGFIYNLTKIKDYLIGNSVGISIDDKKKMLSMFRNAFGEPEFYWISQQGLEYSIRFVQFYTKKLSILSLLVNDQFSSTWVIDHVIDNLSLKRTLKETLIMYFLWAPKEYQEGMSKIYAAVSAYIQNKEYQQRLTILSERVSGKTMANFTLPDVDGNRRSLDEFKGKVVLIDFWFTGCGGCAYYYTNTLSKIAKTFKNNKEVVLISISIDESREIWLKSIKENKYTSSDGTNLYTEGLGSQHNLIRESNIVGYPTIILLSKDGGIKEFSFGNLFTEESLTKKINELL